MWISRLPVAAATLAASFIASGCARSGDAPALPALEAAGVVDAGNPTRQVIVLPDAGPEAIALAERMIKQDHPQAPPLRLDLIADLNASSLLGLAPGDPAAALERRLGPPEKAGELWRWPGLGVEAIVQGGVARRIALHASAVDPEMKIFVGEVLVGREALTQRAPHLRIREVVHVLGADGARGQTDGNVTELGWKRGPAAVLYLTFDEKLQLEAIVLEQFNAPLWQSMKSLETNRQLWDLEPAEASAQSERENIAFAQLPPELAASDIARLRLIAGPEPRGKLFFDALASRFLQPGESLRRVGGGRAAMLRTETCTYLVLEKSDGSWEARNPNAVCGREDEARGLSRLRAALAAPAKGGH